MLPAFYTQKLPVGTQPFTIGGAPVVFDIPRVSAISRIRIYCTGVIGTAANVASVEGLPKLIQSVLLRGTITGSNVFEPISNLTGPDLFEFAQTKEGTLPMSSGALGTAAAFGFDLPLIFSDPFFRGQQASGQPNRLLTAIPAFQMSGLTLTITPATLAQVDTGTGTFVLTSGTFAVELEQYFPQTLPANYNFIRSSYELSLVDTGILTSNPRQLQIAAGGHYTGILLRSFSGANTKQAEFGGAPFLTPNGDIILYDLNRYTKVETDFNRLRASNALITNGGFAALVTGNAFFAFNRGETSVFQTSAIGTAQNSILLNYNAVASAGSNVRIVSRRLFDPSNYLGIPIGV